MGFAIHQHELATGIDVTLHPEPHPSGLSQSTGFGCLVSCIELALVTYFTYGNIHSSMYIEMFFQIIPPLPSHTESKRLFFTSVSLLLSLI